MKPIEDQLLESLGSGVRLFDPHPIDVPAAGPDFELQLQGALAGDPSTTLGIRFAPSVSGMLEQEDQDEIARALDRIAAAGIEQALILHGQRTLRIDVRNRIVLEVYPVSDRSVVDGIDGFVSLQEPTNDESDEEKRPADTPARVVRNASLVHALAGRVLDS